MQYYKSPMIDWLMQEFPTWFTTGLYHILDIEGMDHMLFLWCLCVRYTLYHWKPVLNLVTAFTIGHSITLFTSTTGMFRLPSHWIELAIAVTILVSATLPFIKVKPTKFGDLFQVGILEKTSKSSYVLALIFGFIHGMGFSNLLTELLGRQSSVIGPLFGFNVGIEAGQLVFVLAVLSVTTVIVSKIERRPNELSGTNPNLIAISLIVGIIISLQMIAERISTMLT